MSMGIIRSMSLVSMRHLFKFLGIMRAVLNVCCYVINSQSYEKSNLQTMKGMESKLLFIIKTTLATP